MTQIPKSNCCNAEIKETCGDDFGTPGDMRTYWHECQKCKQPCDPNYSEKLKSSKPFGEQPQNGLKDCHCKEDWYEPEKCKNGICGASHCEKCSKSGNSENSVVRWRRAGRVWRSGESSVRQVLPRLAGIPARWTRSSPTVRCDGMPGWPGCSRSAPGS